MLPLKMEAEDKAGLEILIFQDLFQIFLKIFLVTLEKKVEEKDLQILEVQI